MVVAPLGLVPQATYGHVRHNKANAGADTVGVGPTKHTELCWSMLVQGIEEQGHAVVSCPWQHGAEPLQRWQYPASVVELLTSLSEDHKA